MDTSHALVDALIQREALYVLTTALDDDRWPVLGLVLDRSLARSMMGSDVAPTAVIRALSELPGHP